MNAFFFYPEIVVENAQDVPSQHVTEAKPLAISPQMPPVPEKRIPSPQPSITEVRSVAKTPQPDDSPSVQAISSDGILLFQIIFVSIFFLMHSYQLLII